ncbi:MAG: hypothetical protein ACJAVF_000385, partial [Paraglaciecola sp.]
VRPFYCQKSETAMRLTSGNKMFKPLTSDNENLA